MGAPNFNLNSSRMGISFHPQIYYFFEETNSDKKKIFLRQSKINIWGVGVGRLRQLFGGTPRHDAALTMRRATSSSLRQQQLRVQR